MEKKTIVKLSVSAVVVILAVLFLCGIVGSGEVTYQAPGPYAAESANDFSTVRVEMTLEGETITDCAITSEGASDLLNDEIRAAWAQSIVDSQSADNDVISGATLTYSAASVKEAVDDIFVQAGLREPAAEAEAEPEAEAETEAETEAEAEAEPEAEPEAEAAGLTDGTYTVQKTTDFSTIDVTMTVEGGKVVDAAVASEGANDLLNDDHRGAWASQIVEKQAVDAVSGVTVSSAAVQEAVAELMAQASAGAAAPEAADDGRVAELEAALADVEARFADVEARVADVETRVAGLEAAAVEAAAAVEEAPAASAGATDAQRLMRARPGLAAAPAEAAAEEVAEAMTEEQRLASILPKMVTTMGANRENSYVTDYLEQDPYLVNIYEGYGFAKDYGSARGHEYSLEDVAKTQRPHPKANCLTCKTPDLHKKIAEEGVSVYSMPFDEVMAQTKNNVSCYTCHGDDMGNGGALEVTHQYVNEALGDNVSAIMPATMSCGQCHIEYYFTPEDSEAMMPYHSVAEMTPEAILAYYDAMDFADWTQESTGTRMLKAQHPELETVMQGKHAALLSCADCHMPTETTDDGVSYRSHTLVSPLQNEALLETCAKCHGETDMAAYVGDIQQRITARETEVGNKLSALKDALAEAVASGERSEDELTAIRKLHREAQWFFDFDYVENSEGAHNSALADRCLDTAQAKIDEAMALLKK